MEHRGALLLVGMMGSGKSSVGRLLAARLGFAFIDTDQCVEAAAGRSVARVFAEDGEARFRELERQVLAGLPDQRAVVALGGGAVVAAENRALLRGKGTLVWLDAQPETLARRVGDGAGRPLLAGLDPAARIERLRDLALQRETAYRQAGLRVSTDQRTPAQVCDALLAALAALPTEGPR